LSQQLSPTELHKRTLEKLPADAGWQLQKVNVAILHQAADSINWKRIL